MTDDIPSMGGTKIGPYLRHYAAGVGAGRAIVEVGSWLGAGTVHLAQGIVDSGHNTPLYVYDRFRTTRLEIPKAAKFGVTLSEGQNTQPLVEDRVRPFGVDAHFQRGNLDMANWTHGPIGLYVDDAAKTEPLFLHVVHTFGPYWVPDETVLVLMDFGYWRSMTEPDKIKKYKFQQDFVADHAASFEMIEREEDLPGSTAVFRYRKPLPFKRIPRPDRGLKSRLRRLRRTVSGAFG